MPLVWTDAHRLHDPAGEIWVGVRTPGTELAARAEAIREALADAGAAVVAARSHDDKAVTAVHSPDLLEFLAGAWSAWEAADLPTDPGQDRVVPYVFPVAGLVPDGLPFVPAATWARTGFFCFDTMTLIGPGTWDAARAAADVALTAVDLVLGVESCSSTDDGLAPLTARPGAASGVAYACCRPPRSTLPLRWILLPEQRSDRRAALPRSRCRARRVDRRRRAPRQRGPGDLLEPCRRVHRVRARRPGDWLVSSFPRARARAWRSSQPRPSPSCGVSVRRRRRRS
jgi:hypothetical protein